MSTNNQSWIPKPDMRIFCIENGEKTKGTITTQTSTGWRILWDSGWDVPYPVQEIISRFRPDSPQFTTGQHITWHARGYIVAIHDSGVEVKFTELADTLIVPFEEIEGAQS